MDTAEPMERTVDEEKDWQQEPEQVAMPVGEKPEVSQSLEYRVIPNLPTDNPDGHLLHSADIDELRSRWERIQIEFVDEPHRSVEQADKLITELINRLAHRYSERRAIQESHPEGVDDSTEELRIALKDYRSFFNRMLEI